MADYIDRQAAIAAVMAISVISRLPGPWVNVEVQPNLRKHGIINVERMAKAVDAKQFFMACLEATIPRICVENPVPGRIHQLPPYNQIVQPYMFGDPWLKRTCLWIKNLPILMETDIVVPTGKWVETTHNGRASGNWAVRGHSSAKNRSKSFPGIARAMAEQWGGLING